MSEAVLWNKAGGGWTVATITDYLPYGEHDWQASECAHTKPVDEANVASVLGSDCPKCVSLVVGGATAFHDALVMVAAAHPAQLPPLARWSRGARVGFATAPCGAKWTW